MLETLARLFRCPTATRLQRLDKSHERGSASIFGEVSTVLFVRSVFRASS
jgi:hypothetical protein